MKVGYIGPLSGPGQPYSIDQVAGLKSAVKVISKLDGPNLDITYLDNKSGDAQAGISAVRQLTAQGVDLLFSSYIGDFGALFTPVAHAKTFTIDAGGTSRIAWGHPYFWNAAQDWTQALPGQFVALRKKYPGIKSFVFVTTDMGPDLNKSTQDQYRAAGSAQGFDMKSTLLIPQGNTNFASALNQLQSLNPELVCLSLTNTVGNFMTQYLQAGQSAPVDGGVLNPVDLQVGGSAMNGVTSTSAYFFPNRPTNPLAELLVNEYVGKASTFTPNWNAGFFFQAAINMWEASMRCREAGQSITGENMNTQMSQSPLMHSPFGGTSSKVAEINYDPKTHIPGTGTVLSCVIQGGNFYLTSSNNLTGTQYEPFKPTIRAT
jgi:ABC-type branched-subunit amino acid transport system substrate-binding protein